jgi:hypothetical protein
MAISLYEASVLSYLQTLGAVSGYLEKGLAHYRDNNMDPEAITDLRLFPDMQPFRYQIQSLVHHSVGAVEATRTGVFRPNDDMPAHDYAGLQALVADARASLQKLTPEEVNARQGADVIFKVRDIARPFTAEGFLLSFSLPNFHFHATTAYNILRSHGVPVGKRDYMGALRLNVH